MVFIPDTALAQNLESFEAESSAEHAQIQNRLYPQTGAAVQAVAGGQAVYCGRKSPLSQVYGLGLSGQVHENDLVKIERFYRSRDQDTRIRVCPLADPALSGLLNQRGYHLHSFLNVYVHPLGQIQIPSLTSDPEIKVACLEESQEWFERLGSGGDWAEPDGIAFMTIFCMLKTGTRLFLAMQAGQPVAAGALEFRNGIAGLMAGDTLPAYRKQGIHTALLQARLAAAQEAGCKMAMIEAVPGAPSQGNILRAGFQLAYTSTSVIKKIRKKKSS